jgi:anaerobic magnesium-protoporphyrin IX monomethyl ester cyclase
MRILFTAYLLRARNFQPLGLEYLSSSLKRCGHEVRLADASLPKKLLKTVAQWRPHVIGYQALTGTHRSLLQLNSLLKRRFTFVAIFGGPHPTYFPEMIEQQDVEMVCLGEADDALLEVVSAISERRDPSSVKNFWIKHDGAITKNALRPLLSDLDRLPYPDWSLSDALSYCREFPVRSFMAARGCPFNCTFCYNSAFRDLYQGQQTFRQRKPGAVVEEIFWCYEQRPFSVAYLFDDTFGVNTDWIVQFCDVYRQKIRVPFFVQLRADVISEKVVHQMAQSGLIGVGLGVEVGSEDIRIRLLNKRISNKELLNAASILKKYGVRFIAYNILGLPETTLEDDIATLRFNWQMKPDFAESLMFQPYPRTALGENAAALGYFSGDPDEIPHTMKRKSPLKLSDYNQRVRLMHLFSLLAAYPVSEPILRLLLNIPLDSGYRLISRVFDGFIKTRNIFRSSPSLSLTARALWYYLRF